MVRKLCSHLLGVSRATDCEVPAGHQHRQMREPGGLRGELSTTELQNLLLEQDIFVLTGTKLDLCLAFLQLFTLRELRRLQQAPRSKSRDDLLRQAEQQLRQKETFRMALSVAWRAWRTAPGCLNTCGCSGVAPRRCANGLCRVCCLSQLAGLECRLHEDDDDFLLSDSEEESADADRQGCAARCGALAPMECENHRAAAAAALSWVPGAKPAQCTGWRPLRPAGTWRALQPRMMDAATGAAAVIAGSSRGARAAACMA
ncbi:unnamed protein product [Effrenium voratum]|nr:unnamed protein product [Effrenium voratum]